MPKVSYTTNDLDILSRTIWGEARGEPRLGQIAVAYTVLNRLLKFSWYGKTVAGVCQKKWQYSCWLDSDPNKAKMVALTGDQLAPYREIGRLVLTNAEPDPTSGSTHYFAMGIATPKWAVGLVPVVTIGHHHFYNHVE